MTNGHIAVLAVLAGLVAGYLAPWLSYWRILGWRKLELIRPAKNAPPSQRDSTEHHCPKCGHWCVHTPPYTVTPTLTGAGPAQPPMAPDAYAATGHGADDPLVCERCGKPRQRPLITYAGQFICDECALTHGVSK